MIRYSNYRLEFQDFKYNKEMNGLEFNYAVEDSDGELITEFTAILGKGLTCTPDWYRLEVESFALMADG